MICPHCKKPISTRVSAEAAKRVLALSKNGYSCRDIEKLLRDEGLSASFASISRIIKAAKK